MILVTGGTGFVGSRLVERLASKGYSVNVVSRRGKGPERKGVTYYKADINDVDALRAAADGVTRVIHLAGRVSYSAPMRELMDANLTGTEAVLRACPEADRFILASSVGVYGRIRKGTSADESYLTNPTNSYGRSKLQSEFAVLDSGLESVILRIAPIYGRGSSQWERNLSMLQKGFPIPRTDSLTHIVHVDDVVQAVIRAMKKGKGIYNIADREPVPFTEYASRLVRLLGGSPRIKSGWLLKLGSRLKGMAAYYDVLTMNRSYDISLAMEELGYSPRADLDVKTFEMVDWFLHGRESS